jgi:hypothetical protein
VENGFYGHPNEEIVNTVRLIRGVQLVEQVERRRFVFGKPPDHLNLSVTADNVSSAPRLL